jgi:hypothetical protein
MFLKYILTEESRIKTTPDNIFNVLPEDRKKNIRQENLTITVRRYKLECGQVVYEINCLEIQDKENGCRYLIVPEFMKPKRPYPIYVYIYAIMLYSSNPAMGQRKAAKRTREVFGLQTFSHTTLGRAMKKLVAFIKPFTEEDNNTSEDISTEIEKTKSFPSVDQIRKRKEMVISYLKKASDWVRDTIKESDQWDISFKYKRPPYVGEFIEACHSIVNYTFLNYQRLLF